MAAVGDDREAIRARLRNWGRWARGGHSRLAAINGLWCMAMPGKLPPTADVDDAEKVEYALTSLAQPPRARQWRKDLHLVVIHYATRGRAKDKAEKMKMHRSWYYRNLARIERFLDGIVP